MLDHLIEADAARYRFLRKQAVWRQIWYGERDGKDVISWTFYIDMAPPYTAQDKLTDETVPNAIDAAIDKAIAK